MNTDFIFWCIPFIMMSVFHLAMCLKDTKKVTDISKILLMPLLLCGLWSFVLFSLKETIITHNVKFLTMGLFFCWAGDVFLLKEKNPSFFIKGLISFFIGHVCYLYLLCTLASFLPLPTGFCVVTILIGLGIVIFSWFMNNKPKGGIGVAIIMYATLLVSFNVIAVFLMVGHRSFNDVPSNLYTLLIGTLFFLLSDAVLSFTIFVKQFPYHRFIVMSTYLVAQFFIVYSLVTL